MRDSHSPVHRPSPASAIERHETCTNRRAAGPGPEMRFGLVQSSERDHRVGGLTTARAPGPQNGRVRDCGYRGRHLPQERSS